MKQIRTFAGKFNDDDLLKITIIISLVFSLFHFCSIKMSNYKVNFIIYYSVENINSHGNSCYFVKKKSE